MQAEVRVKKGGPYIIKGKFKLTGIDGKEIIITPDKDGQQIACICSCGLSKTMPLCDGSHNRVQKQ